MRQGVLEAPSRRKLHDSFSGPRGVSVGVSDFASRPEVVLQILPRGPGRDVLDDDPVVGLGSGRVATPPSVASAAKAPAIAVTTPTPVPGVTGKLHADTPTLHVLAVQVGDGVVGVPEFNVA